MASRSFMTSAFHRSGCRLIPCRFLRAKVLLAAYSSRCTALQHSLQRNQRPPLRVPSPFLYTASHRLHVYVCASGAAGAGPGTKGTSMESAWKGTRAEPAAASCTAAGCKAAEDAACPEASCGGTGVCSLAISCESSSSHASAPPPSSSVALPPSAATGECCAAGGSESKQSSATCCCPSPQLAGGGGTVAIGDGLEASSHVKGRGGRAARQEARA
mmetsp:Transcript_27857/g.65711  ORF Transcript_27857/g.65711 Transcript_27857/m.65711 type:complete len:216 (-) Transcript_27857:2-649(-)